MHTINSELWMKRYLPKIPALITGFVLGAAIFSMHSYAAPPANTIKQSSPRLSTPDLSAQGSGRPGPSLEEQVQQLTQKLNQLEQKVESLKASNSAVGQQQQVMYGQIAALENVISVSSSGAITISTAGTLTLTASTVELSADVVNLQAAMTRAHGIIQADTVITNSVVAKSYTPGAGNLW